jgi:hypothetical protein
MYINLIGVLAIEERHKRASLWVQSSVSKTDAAITPNLAVASLATPHQTVANSRTPTAPSPQPQSSPAANLNLHLSVANPQTPHIQTQAMTAQTMTAPPSSFPSSQPTHPAMSQSGGAQPSRPDSPMTGFMKSTSDMYTWGGNNSMSTSDYPFDFSGMDFSGMDFSGVPSSHSGPFFGMESTDLWNSTNTSGMNLNTSGASLPGTMASINSMPMPNVTLQPTLPTFAPQNNSLPGTMASMPMPNVADTLQPTLPTLAPQNNSLPGTMASMPMPNVADTLQPARTLAPQNNPTSVPPSQNNSTPHSSITATNNALPTPTPQNNSTPDSSITATNTMPSGVTDAGETRSGDDRSKKRKTYEEENAHCILPEGSCRARKKGNRKGAEDENTAGPKKRNANKKRNGNKEKK